MVHFLIHQTRISLWSPIYSASRASPLTLCRFLGWGSIFARLRIWSALMLPCTSTRSRRVAPF
ncbi:protein of unknown function [Thauera humireducens]|nr:protein of unknown function [Thauera humireducens]